MRNEDDMRLFVSIVKSGTLQGATSSSSLTRSGISKRLSRLEQRLGVRLLNRTTRSIALTSAGTAYYEASSRILDEIVAIEESVSASGRNLLGTLHVAAPSVLAEQILIPLLADFHAANPTVRIKLECAEGRAELVGQSVDLSIRIGKQDDPASISRKLLGGRLLHCGAASYLDAHPVPAAPADLAEHKCVLLSALGTDWNDWPFLSGKQTQTVRVRGPITCNSSNSHYAAVLGGLGIGPVVESVARADIEAGRLRPVLERYSAPDSGAVYAIYPSARQVPGKLRVFLEFLTRRLSPNPARSPEAFFSCNRDDGRARGTPGVTDPDAPVRQRQPITPCRVDHAGCNPRDLQPIASGTWRPAPQFRWNWRATLGPVHRRHA